MTMTPQQAIHKLTAALGQMLTLFEDHLNEELTAREQQVFDQAAELYAQMKDSATVQPGVKKGVRRAS